MERTLESLPDENIIRILLKLSRPEISAARKASKRIDQLCRDQDVLDLFIDQGFIQTLDIDGNLKDLPFPCGYVKKLDHRGTLVVLNDDDCLYMFHEDRFKLISQNVVDFAVASRFIYYLSRGRIYSFHLLTERHQKELTTDARSIVCGHDFQAVLTQDGTVLAKGRIWWNGHTLLDNDEYAYICHNATKIVARGNLLVILGRSGGIEMLGFMQFGQDMAAMRISDIPDGDNECVNISLSGRCVFVYQKDSHNIGVFGDGFAGAPTEEFGIMKTCSFAHTSVQHVELSERFNCIVDTNGLLGIFRNDRAKKVAKNVRYCVIYRDTAYLLCRIKREWV